MLLRGIYIKSLNTPQEGTANTKYVSANVPNVHKRYNWNFLASSAEIEPRTAVNQATIFNIRPPGSNFFKTIFVKYIAIFLWNAMGTVTNGTVL